MIKDITGQRFGKLIAIERVADKITPSGNCRLCGIVNVIAEMKKTFLIIV